MKLLQKCSEEERLESLLHFEKEAMKNGFLSIAGVDEAGRGPMAGPVVAAACILPSRFFLPGINDSKQLTPKKRGELFKILKKETQFGIGIVSHEVIDQINILEATHQAMREAVSQINPDFLLVDGMKIKQCQIAQQGIIKGDALSQSIAAASILAKETRDLIMMEYHELYPQYGFDRHKGYGTKMHCDAIKEFGLSPIHRVTFRLKNI